MTPRAYPDATLNLKPGGSAYRVPSAPWRLVLHTTETVGLPAYRSRTNPNSYIPPHITIRRPSAGGRHVWQHRYFDQSAAALLNPGNCETNHRRALQIEILGYAKDSQSWPTEDYAFLAEVVDWFHDHFGIQLTYPTAYGSDAYGPNSRARMTCATWAAYDGVCGHQHVPGNAHWDPGRLDWDRLLAQILLRKVPEMSKYFVDVHKNHTHAGSIDRAYELGLVQGVVEDGKRYYHPNDQLTRGQAASIFVRAFDKLRA